MKQLLTLLLICVASTIFSQTAPKPLVINNGISIKGNAIIQIDKDKLSNSKTAVPTSELVTKGTYKINPPSNALWTGITSLDTNTVNYGRIVQRDIFMDLPFNKRFSDWLAITNDSIILSKNANKSVNIDELVTSGADYKLNITSVNNVNWHIKKWITQGGGGANGATCIVIDSSKPGLSAAGSANIIKIDRFITDSTAFTNGGYPGIVHYFRKTSNKSIVFDYGQINCNTVMNLIYSGSDIVNNNILLKIDEMFTKIPTGQTSVLYSGDYGTVYGGNGTFNNTQFVIEIDLLRTEGAYAPINIQNVLTNNSVVTVKVRNAKKYAGTNVPFVFISATTDATSRIIIEGDFVNNSGPCVQINSNANVILRGSFQTLSTTHGAIALTTTAPNVKVQGLLKTGHTESITSTGAQSISILPGSSSNKAVGASVTQVGGTLTVNAGY